MDLARRHCHIFMNVIPERLFILINIKDNHLTIKYYFDVTKQFSKPFYQKQCMKKGMIYNHNLIKLK